MITTSLVFDYRVRTKRGQAGPVHVRVTIDRKSYYVNTGVKVKQNEFRGGSVVNRPDSDVLNERLTIVDKRVNEELNRYMREGAPIDIAAIREKVLKVETVKERVEDDFLKWIDEHINLLNNEPGTISHYRTMYNRLVEYGGIKRWEDLTMESIMAFDKWLHSLRVKQTKAEKLMGVEARHLSDSAVYNYHKPLKRLLYLAKKAKRIKENPYEMLKGEFSKGDKENPEYLTEEEMQAIIDAKIQRGSFLDMVRDLFVVQMFTGMAYADLMAFDIKNYKEVDGKWIANDDRVKSGVAFVGHLLPPVVAVLQKYNWHLPEITNQVYNRGLKQVQKKAKVKTILHSHLARHTFATYMLGNGVKVENLQRMMGHKDISMTQRYAKTLAQSVHDEFDMIAEKLKKG